MRAIASFVMRGPAQAALVACLGSLSYLVLPPGLIIGGAAVALVTLRQGTRPGALVVAAALAGAAALSAVLLGTIGPALFMAPLFWLPLWALALTLRATLSLPLTLMLGALMGWAAVLAQYLLLGDAVAWWGEVLRQVLGPLLQGAGIEAGAPLEGALAILAPMMPGLTAANGLAMIIFSLLLGRWWQALLYNPGGFREEFHTLRLGRPAAAVAAAVLALGVATGAPVLVNLATVVALVYVFQGLAVVHGSVALAGLSRAWIIALYVLAFLALVQVVLLLCVLGVVDAWVDLRARLAARKRSS